MTIVPIRPGTMKPPMKGRKKRVKAKISREKRKTSREAREGRGGLSRDPPGLSQNETKNDAKLCVILRRID
jgi:hypothetical protein